MEPFTAYDNGIGFANAFRLLLSRTSLSALSKSQSYTDATMIMPTIVNGALACELFLKALINDKCYGHSILELLNEAEQKNPGMKQNLQSQCISFMQTRKGNNEYTEEKYGEDLKRFDKSFVVLRYWHEPRQSTADEVYSLDFLEVLVAILQTLCIQKYGTRPVSGKWSLH